MPIIGLHSTTLHQNQADPDEVDLFKNCLTPEEAEYSHFIEPGGILGFGLGVATLAGYTDLDTPEEKNTFIQPVQRLSNQFWSKNTSAKHVIAGLIDAYGCQPVKKYIKRTKKKRDQEAERKKWEQKWGLKP